VGSTSLLDRGRQAVARRAWREAHEALTAARRTEPLGPQDLWRLALASYLVGMERDFVDALGEAHQLFLESGDTLDAVRTAFWMGQYLASRGDVARASGWFGRAARVVEERQPEGAARGYLLVPLGHRQFEEGEYEACAQTCRQAAEIGRECRDGDLTVISVHLEGRAALRAGRLDEGLALVDEAMVAVAEGALSPMARGLVYCSVISACREVYALRRAQEWTAALTDWCEEQPDMVAYSGPCRVSRAEILLRRGSWHEAEQEAERAVARYEQGSGPGPAGPAFYQQGEVHRLRGEYTAAEEAYRSAAQSGKQPQPGLALLRLAQGEPRAAEASLRRALAETREPLRRAQLLPPFVQALIAVGDLEGASGACEELSRIADTWRGQFLDAVAAQTRGATLLASGDAEGALAPLRRACTEWDAHDAPYDAAMVRLLLSHACAALGDLDGAAMELGAARATFEQLGAAPDLTVGGEVGTGEASDNGLTPREREVLRWLATGATNREIGKHLYISEKTVARHVANIFTKLAVSSRAAATAYAYEHGLARFST